MDTFDRAPQLADKDVESFLDYLANCFQQTIIRGAGPPVIDIWETVGPNFNPRAHVFGYWKDAGDAYIRKQHPDKLLTLEIQPTTGNYINNPTNPVFYKYLMACIKDPSLFNMSQYLIATAPLREEN